MDTKIRTTKHHIAASLILTGAERLALLRGIRGMWKNRKSDPVKELKKIRSGWTRKLPSL